jgi:Carboxypeptidase regulatory-like domain
VWCCLLIAITGAGFGYSWINMSSDAVRHKQPAAATPGFVPVVGEIHDQEDTDPDITVEQPLVPGFQFQKGGFQLSGRVIDVQSGQPVMNAIVWITMPVQKGRPTSIALHVVTDALGYYQFQHLAAGIYTVAASRYYNVGDGRYYAERIFSALALRGDRSGFMLSLAPISAPGKRSFVTGRAKNVILIDLRGFYANSLLSDAQLANLTPDLRAFLQHANVLKSVWHPYGWRPLDQYALLTGSYPQWATFDTWPRPVPWGAPDAVDTRFWFTGGRSPHLFGQESIFDVAKGYGMQTEVVAGADYILSDATTRNVDLLQRSSAFNADRWLSQMEDAVASGTQQENGFLLYGELAPLAPEDMSSSPDAQGDDYQRALQIADQTFGQFIDWLGQQGLLQNTLIALTTSQAQANHTDADNFYGMGITGQGTSKQTLLAVSGAAMCKSSADNNAYTSFVIAPILMHALGLPAAEEARVEAPGGCL